MCVYVCMCICVCVCVVRARVCVKAGLRCGYPHAVEGLPDWGQPHSGRHIENTPLRPSTGVNWKVPDWQVSLSPWTLSDQWLQERQGRRLQQMIAVNVSKNYEELGRIEAAG